MESIMLVSLCVQLAQDATTELFNSDYVRSRCSDKRADIIETNNRYRRLFSKIRQSLTQGEFNDYLNDLDTMSERWSYVSESVNSLYFAECVTRYKYNHCSFLSGYLTVVTLLHTASSLFEKTWGSSCKLVDDIMESFLRFADRYEVSALDGGKADEAVGDVMIRVDKVGSVISDFLNKALKE